MKYFYKEALSKNIVLSVLLIVSYLFLLEAVQITPALTSGNGIASLLLSVKIVAVTACFGIFTFHYGDVRKVNQTKRAIAHITTGMLLLVIGISLQMTAILTSLLVGPFPLVNYSLFLLYLACVFYDFWSLERSIEVRSL